MYLIFKLFKINAVKKNKIFMRIFTFISLLFCSFYSFSQNGIIKGNLANQLNNEPISFANVLIIETAQGASSDENGNFEINGLVPGLYNLKISFVGFKDVLVSEIQVSNSKPSIVNVKMEEISTKINEVVIKSAAFRKIEESPLSLRNIGIAEIQRNPGANRDISKVIQSLPGVTSVASFRNDLIIRGGAPNENRFYLDDIEVPNINHFATQGASGGPVGLINVDFINEVDFYSGAFPANRGNTMSSVFNFKQRDTRDDRIGLTATISPNDIGLTVEGPISKDKSNTLLLSVRRSYLQLLFKALKLPFLPTYHDYQFKYRKKWKKSELYIVGLGALDQFDLNLDANETESQKYLLGNLPVTPQWNYTQGLVYKKYRNQGYTTFVVSRNMLNNEAYKYEDNDESVASKLRYKYKSQEIENKLRIENTERFGTYKLNAGVGYEYVKYNNNTFNRIATPNGPDTINYQSSLNFSKYYLFGQLSKNFFNEKLIASFGIRADGNSYSKEMSNPLDQFSPRLSLSYAINQQFSINFNTGIYYQLPPYTVLGYKKDESFVNKNNQVKFIENQQIVAGLEYRTSTSSRITLEGFYKKYDKYPFLLRDSISLANLGGDFGVIGNESVTSISKGRSYGMELMVQQRMFKGFYGIAAYTFSYSEFQDKLGVYRPSSWDSRHIFSLTAGKQFKKNWEIGISWRYQSGLPFTPANEFASSLVSNWNVRGAELLDYNQLNSNRLNNTNYINLRVDKKWFFKKWSLNVFLDIQNLLENKITRKQLILDVPLDNNGNPVGQPSIINPTDPINVQRYKLKYIDNTSGTRIPSIGIIVSY